MAEQSDPNKEQASPAQSPGTESPREGAQVAAPAPAQKAEKADKTEKAQAKDASADKQAEKAQAKDAAADKQSQAPAPAEKPAPAQQAHAPVEKPEAQAPAQSGSLYEALRAAVRVAAAERSAEPLVVVLGRAVDEAQDGDVSGSTKRMLNAALSAATHNPHLSDATRAALNAVRGAL